MKDDSASNAMQQQVMVFNSVSIRERYNNIFQQKVFATKTTRNHARPYKSLNITFNESVAERRNSRTVKPSTSQILFRNKRGVPRMIPQP